MQQKGAETESLKFSAISLSSMRSIVVQLQGGGFLVMSEGGVAALLQDCFDV